MYYQAVINNGRFNGFLKERTLRHLKSKAKRDNLILYGEAIRVLTDWDFD